MPDTQRGNGSRGRVVRAPQPASLLTADAIDDDDSPEDAPVFSDLHAVQTKARTAASQRMQSGKGKARAQNEAHARAAHVAPVQPEPEPEPLPEPDEPELDDPESDELTGAAQYSPEQLEEIQRQLDAYRQQQEARQEQVNVDPFGLFGVGVPHVDRLWDWVRQDPDRGAAFLGKPAASSLEVHVFFDQLRQGEAMGVSMARAIHYANEHIGFALWLPIIEQRKLALAHLYLSPAVRGYLPQLLPSLVEHAMRLRPDLRLVVMSNRPEWARLLQPMGFREQIVLVRD